MAIQIIYKVPGLSAEFETEQEAMIAEAIDQCEGLYIENFKLLKLVRAITSKYFLMPIVETVTIQEVEPGFCGDDPRDTEPQV